MADYDSYDVKAYIRQREHLRLREDVLYILPKERQEDWIDMKIIVPKEFREMVMEGCHEDLSHLDLERTLDLL